MTEMALTEGVRGVGSGGRLELGSTHPEYPFLVRLACKASSTGTEQHGTQTGTLYLSRSEKWTEMNGCVALRLRGGASPCMQDV